MAKRKNRPIFKESDKVKRPDGSYEIRESDWYYVRWTDVSGRRRKMRAAPTFGQAREVYARKLGGVAA